MWGRDFRLFSWRSLTVLLVCTALVAPRVFGASTEDYSNLKKEVEDLKKKLTTNAGAPKVAGPIGKASASVANKYGPNAPVTTKTGKLQIGGLLQVWAYHINNDNRNAYVLINDSRLARFFRDTYNSNEINDNDSYRIRRAEIKFSMDINDDVTGVVMIDPTGGDEANTFPGMPTNQGVVGLSAISGSGDLSIENLRRFVESLNGLAGPQPGGEAKQRMRTGFMKPNRVLQDAYINYHPHWIPNHDFTIGQFKPPMSEEGNRNSGQLDFVERAMINQFSNQRDLGVMVHGTWFDNRFQYWFGAFDGAGNFHNTFASYQNRSDDNDEKDFAFRVLGRPIWNMKNWGSLEIGYSRQDGKHGESSKGFGLNAGGFITLIPDTDGLNLQESRAFREYLWGWYRPGGPVRGWWFRGEYARWRDRPTPGIIGVSFPELRPGTFKREGFYLATGYKLSDSIWADTLKNHPNWLIKMAHDVEFVYRYEKFGNIVTDSLTRFSQVFSAISIPNSTDVFSTRAQTVGVNYYWRGYNTRTQINYIWVDEPHRHPATIAPAQPGVGNEVRTGDRFREVNNNMFVISQQIMW